MIDERIWEMIKDKIYVGPQGLNYAFKNALILYNLQYIALTCKHCNRLVLDCNNDHSLKLLQGGKNE